MNASIGIIGWTVAVIVFIVAMRRYYYFVTRFTFRSLLITQLAVAVLCVTFDSMQVQAPIASKSLIFRAGRAVGINCVRTSVNGVHGVWLAREQYGAVGIAVQIRTGVMIGVWRGDGRPLIVVGHGWWIASRDAQP